MLNAKMRQREVDALLEAMVKLKLERGIIVTRREEEQLKFDDRTIDVIPAWQFLLDFSREFSDI